MKNYLLKGFLFSIFMTAASCSYPIYSPSVSVENASRDVIKVTKFNWNGYRLVEGHYYGDIPGARFGQSFVLQKTSHLYGPIIVEWQNSKKEKLVKEIEFKKEYLPNFNRKTLASVYFYLTQDDVKMFVRNGTLDRSEEEEKIAKQAVRFQKEYEAAHPEKCFKAYGCGNKASR